MARTSAVSAHRARLAALRADTEARLARTLTEYETLTVDADDVGGADDEGGAELDGTLVERDRLRSLAAEDTEVLKRIDDAVTRSKTRQWQTCRLCGQPIGEPRLEALPTTDVCVTCKAAGTVW